MHSILKICKNYLVHTFSGYSHRSISKPTSDLSATKQKINWTKAVCCIAFFSEKALEQFWLALHEGSNRVLVVIQIIKTKNYNYN
jgi:hypothetical protein